MKSNILRKRIESIARLALISVLSLTMVFESFALVDAADGDAIAYNGYTWHRMYCERDMEEFYLEGKTNQDQRMFLGQVRSTGVAGAQDSTESAWFRVMIIYSDDHYYLGGTNMCNDGESYSGTYIKGTYGIEPSKETFTTQSGMNTPWIKKCGTDGRNDNDCLYYIRSCDGNDKLGNRLACMNLNWYGVHHHAAAYSECRWIGVWSDLDTCSGRHCYGSDDECEYKMSCSACVHIEHTFRWQRSFKESFYDEIKSGELTINQAHSIWAAYSWKYDSNDGKQHYSGNYPMYSSLKLDSPKRIEFVKSKCTDTSYYDNSIFDKKDFKLSDYSSNCENYEDGSTKTKNEGTTAIYFDIEGVSDRCYYYPDNDWEINTSKNETGSNRGFKIWIGEPRAVAVVTKSQALAPGSTVIYDDISFANGTVLVVPKNSTLIVRGYCYNDGEIFLNGGTLIVEGVLDTHRNGEVKNVRLPDDVCQFTGYSSSATYTVVPGSVNLYNNSTLIVEDDAVLISSRYQKSSVVLNSGSHATICGSLTTASLKAYNSTIRGRAGSVMLIGYDPGDLNKGDSYGKTYFANHKNDWLSSLGSNIVATQTGADGKSGEYLCKLVVSNSSLQQKGLFYLGPWTTATYNDYSIDVIAHSNVEATISAMMRNW